MKNKNIYLSLFIIIIVFGLSQSVLADPPPAGDKTAIEVAEELQLNLNIVWTCVAASQHSALHPSLVGK